MTVQILIVDDNLTNMKLAADVLESEGCQVSRAADADQALALLSNAPPDLILMDLSLPRMDGLSLTRLLKADCRYMAIPIVAVTASAMTGDEAKAMDSGCQGFITKPIDTTRFVQQVFAFLPTPRQESTPTAPPAQDRMSLLVVDDSARNRKLLRASLEYEGHLVLEAGNGLEALQTLERNHVDAVISDILMPVMDGFRMCREIRSRDASFSAVPIILCTASYNSSADRELARTVGADDYLVKPAPISLMLQSLSDARRKSRARTGVTAAPTEATEVLEQYNAALVRKLDQRNGQLQQSLTDLQSAHTRIVELNKYLELRVEQRTAALESANQELEAFSHTVAHDLRAPLGRIRGYADLLKDSAFKQLSDDDRSFVDQITGSAKSMDSLIGDLLAFARTASTALAIGEVDLDRVVDEAVDAVRHETQGRQIQWKRSPLPRVRGDAALLRQVYINLISNAVKYTRTRPHPTIEIGSRPGRSHEIVLFVRDNGVGFDMAHAVTVFGAFKRLHDSKEFEGTGIGLANVQRIIARHGGRVWTEAAVDRGATFYFTLPPDSAPAEHK